MALIKCEECGKQISDKAESCPKCGAPIKTKEKNKKCKKCGDMIPANAAKCPHCFSKEEETDEKKKNKLPIIIIISIILIGAIVGLIIFFASQSDDDDDVKYTKKDIFAENAINVMKAGQTAYVSDSLDGNEKNKYTISSLIGEYIDIDDDFIDGCVLLDVEGDDINATVYVTNKEYMVIGATLKELSKNKGKYVQTYSAKGSKGWKSGYEYCSFDDDIEDDNKNTKNKKGISLGDTFIFDDLEITLGTNISFTKLKNSYSEYNGKDVIKLPITTKNLKNETHSLNMFYYTLFGSQGTEVKNASSYFDDSIDYAGDLRPGASYTKFLYFVYDGDGEYAIEFDDWEKKLTIEFDVKK